MGPSENIIHSSLNLSILYEKNRLQNGKHNTLPLLIGNIVWEIFHWTQCVSYIGFELGLRCMSQLIHYSCIKRQCMRILRGPTKNLIHHRQKAKIMYRQRKKGRQAASPPRRIIVIIPQPELSPPPESPRSALRSDPHSGPPSSPPKSRPTAAG